MTDKFDDIRPYNDQETVAALHRLADKPVVTAIQNYLFPDMKPGEFSGLLRSVKGVDDLQNMVMTKVISSIIDTSTLGLSCGGLENFILPGGIVGRFLLLSTHRDIVLDPAFIQYVLALNNLPCTEIAVGNNLMVNSTVEDMIRSNRMIKVVRSENPREVYFNSSRLSDYIRGQITGGRSSVWIAHRQGRTKDGMDQTGQGLLKMLDMSGKDSFTENFSQLNIMPVTVSYEYESCGAMKALEDITREKQGFYRKSEGEDLTSMIEGIRQFKGHVHIEFCKPVPREVYEKADTYPKNDKYRYLCEYMDGVMFPAFKLWPSNYAAADILENGTRYSDHYSPQDKESLLDHIEKESAGMPPGVKTRLLEIYSAHILKKSGK